MDLNVILNAIATLGFPIVCCGALFYKMNKDEELHREDSKEWQKAIENNTLVIQKFIDKVDKGE